MAGVHMSGAGHLEEIKVFAETTNDIMCSS